MKIVKLEDQIVSNFEEYANYVNEERAIPFLYDGLKPVARRILYTMWKMKLFPDKQTRKCANIVGQTMAYHPHGNSSIYGALVRFAQDFSVKVPLIDGLGNFGSLEMPPAAERYTEARLSKLGYSIVEKLSKNIVPMVPNYDGTENEPEFLPAPVPILLNSGTMGIGVGMAVSIPSHNLDEIIDATIALIKNPTLSTEGLLEYIKGPDFPSGCSIVNQKDFLGIYRNGKGSFVMRAIFEYSGNILTIKNLPFYSIAAKIEEQILSAKEEGKFREILSVVNTTAKEQELRLTLMKNIDVDSLIRDLCFSTDAQRTIHLDLRAIDGAPKIFNLLDFLTRWLEIHYILVRKELMQDKAILDNKLEINEGILKALLMIDEIIELIKLSENRIDAKQKLMQRSFSEIQANAILDIKLSRLTHLEYLEIEDNINELKIKIAEFEQILTNENNFKEYIIKNMLHFKGIDKRKSLIVQNEFAKAIKEKNDKFFLTFNQNYVKIVEEAPKGKYLSGDSNHPIYVLSDNYVIPIKNTKESVVTNVYGILKDEDVFHISKDGYIKRTKAEDLKVARKAIATKQDVFVAVQANQGILLITSKSGKQIQFDLTEVPYSGRGAKGVIAVKLQDEEISKVEIISSYLPKVKKGRNKTF